MPSGPSARATIAQKQYREIMGINVARLRRKARLTQLALATKSGVTPDWISMIEHGTVNPTLDVCSSIALALDVPLAEFFFFTVKDR